MQTERAHFLDNRLPPVILVFVVAACMRAAALIGPGVVADWPGRGFVAWALAVAGSLVIFAGVASFARHKTTANPLRPATASNLVDTGVYSRTRNPMYLGLTITLLGYAALLSHPLSLLAVALFPAYIRRFQIAPEERALDQLFGEEYLSYKKRVPRWL